MCASNRLRNPKTRLMMVLGNFSLVAALLLWNFARPSGAMAHALAAHIWIDALCGLLFGVSIGSNLMAVRARRCRSVEDPNL